MVRERKEVLRYLRRSRYLGQVKKYGDMIVTLAYNSCDVTVQHHTRFSLVIACKNWFTLDLQYTGPLKRNRTLTNKKTTWNA